MSRAGDNRIFAVLFAVLMMTSMFAGTVALTGTASAAPGDVLYRVNAGGSTVAATDGGQDWIAGSGSAYVSGGSTYSTASSVSTDGTVPASTPSSVFQSELYGDQQWTFSDGIQSGEEYEVRLYFAEIYHGVDGGNAAGGEGDRVFDVSVEGETVLDDYDIYADVGSTTGTMKSYTVAPDDGQIDVDLTTEVDNAKISAIEIVESEPQPDTLGGPSSVDFGAVVTGDSATETVTVTNLGDDGDADIDLTDASVTGADADEFSAGAPSQATLAPGESADVSVTFSPSDAQSKAATLEIDHSGTNSPLEVALSGEGASDVPVGFSESTLQGFSAGNPTAIDFGPDGRAYVSTQGGAVYALEVERTDGGDYQVVNEEQIDAIEDIPNHDDLGNLDAGETNRQITGLTVGGTAEQPVVYVSSSDPEIRVGQDTDATDTNSGAISRLAFDWNSDGTLASVDHDVMVLGLPRSEENHATNGLDLTADGDTLYVAQGGHTNKGAPGDNFGHTPEYALSAAVLEIDLAQIETNYQAKSLQNENGNYPDLDYLYSIPTVQGGDLPFGGDDGLNQAKIVEDGPVQVYSPGYRNPYDLVLSEDEQLYVIDNGPNGGWGGQPVGDGSTGVCTNAPNEDGSYGTGDQLHLATEGSYGGHATPIRANPDDAGLYDANGNQYHDFDSSDTPVPFDMANPVECDYQDPNEDNSIGPTFGWTGGITEYTASNFGGEMQGDLLVVENANTIKRVQLNAAGDDVTEVTSPFNTAGALGITAQDDDEAYPGTIWTANHGDGDVTVFEPNDFGDGGSGDQCTGADDPSLDEDGDGYDNADEIDAGSDPCSAASTPADFDDDGTSNVNDPDDDNDGLDDTEDPFAIDPNNGLDTDLPVTYDFAPNSESGTILNLGFTGVMTNGQDYQELYDPDEVTAGGAANVLTVENVPQGDAHQNTNTQQHGYQVGVNADEPFTVESTVNGLPSDAEPFQSQGIFIGTGDQDNYAKLTATGFSSGSGSGVQFATEEDGSFTDVANPPAPTAGSATTLSMTVYPSNGTVETYYAVDDGEEQFVGETTVPTSWFDTADGNGTAVGVIATSNGASSTFDATWQNLYVEQLNPPANQPPVADAGADVTVEEGQEVTLDASASSDPDGDTLGYTWTQTAGSPDGLLDMSDSEQVTFTAPDVDGDTTFTFQVEVADGNGGTDTDTVDVTVQDTDSDTGDMSVAEAVAMGGENDTLIEDSEIQQAINWWSTGGEVPNTGGQTIDDSQIQTLINLWATDASVGSGNEAPGASFTVTPSSPAVGEEVTFDASGSTDADGSIASYSWDFDGDGQEDATGQTAVTTYDSAGDKTVELTVTDDEGATATATQTVSVSASGETGSALVEITPDTGIETSTYGGGTYQVTNTGEKEIAAVSFDLSTASLPDMVFDPQGTAGDPTGEGLNIESDGGTGITTAEGDEAFSQPHNGQDADDGYDVMTVEFDDFQNGETATFWADNDPTSIKGATVGSQEAGPVSGLELARSTVTITYADGTTQTTQLMGDGSDGGSTAVVTDDEAPAPTIGAQDVSLDSDVLDGYHSGATVSEASQTITVTGEPGETVTLVRVEGELTLTNVPNDGYDIEEYEANNAQNVEYYTATVGSNGQAEIPVTLTNTTSDGDDNAGYNYFVAAHGEASGDMGLASNVVVLKYDESAGDGDTGDGDVAFAVNAGGSEYTAGDGTVFQADTGFSGGSTYSVTQDIGDTQDDSLYQTERYGDFSYDVPLEDGEYEVTLHFAEIFQGVSENDGVDSTGPDDGTQENDRVFDASIEGQQVLENYDIYAEVGPLNATQETFTAEVTDGELNVQFSTVYDNAKISAIEVTDASSDGGDGNTAPTVDAISDQTVTEGDSASVPVSASDADGDALSLSVNGPSFVSLDDAGDGTGTLTVAPQSGDAGTYTVDVIVDDGTTTTTESFEVTVEAPSSGGTGSADFTVNENGGVDASTYSGGSFEVTNTGNKQISSVTYDLSSATFPDVVFDPDGTAGDSAGKGFTADSGGSATGLQGGSFAAPHNGQDGADGYDELTATFDDFDNGESFAFSTDIDPTSIKDASGTGAAGSVSGLELSGATVTVEYADGSTQTTQLFGDGSDGGSQATATDDLASAPTLGVDGISLDSGALDAQHSAATVAEAGQTITVSGPADATVELLHVEGQLELANQADGYDLEAYEANTAENVDYQTVDLGGNGEATVDVTLTNTSNSGAEGGYNHFVATVQDGDGTGATSNVVVLKYDESGDTTSPEAQVLHRVNAGEDTTVPATDDGPDWTGVSDASSPYLASVASTDVGEYCEGDDITADGTVPSSTPDAVFDCERYGEMTWEFPVDAGQEIEVRLYLANSFPGASEPGDRQFNVSIEGTQVLTQYDPVADVGHATGTTKSFTVTDDGDGTVTVAFEKGAIENPEVRAIEIVEEGGSQ